MIKTKKLPHNSYLDKRTKEYVVPMVLLAAQAEHLKKGGTDRITITDVEEEAWRDMEKKYHDKIKKLIP